MMNKMNEKHSYGRYFKGNETLILYNSEEDEKDTSDSKVFKNIEEKEGDWCGKEGWSKDRMTADYVEGSRPTQPLSTVIIKDEITP